MAKKEETFDFKTHLTNLDLNKYVKEGFARSLEKEPKTLKEFEKLLKKYLGELQGYLLVADRKNLKEYYTHFILILIIISL